MKNDREALEPYRLFFFSGWIISILGVAIWLAYQFNWIGVYPLNSHANLMIAGFLFSYVYGFLMTAVPKMSQTELAHPFEIYTGLALVWLQVLVNYFVPGNLSNLLASLQFLFIFTFVFRRMLIKRANPPAGFVFVLIGLLVGFVGSVVLSLPAGTVTPEVYQLGKSFFYQAFILNLIMGLGSRLIPMLSRVEGAIDIRGAVSESKLYYLALALVLNCAFVMEVFFSDRIGNFLKFAVISFVAVKKFKIFSRRTAKGNLGNGLRASVVMLAAGFLLVAMFPAYAVHFFHVSFIGGFGMLTILISTRVVLAHGQYDLSTELIDRHLVWFVSIFLMLALGRAAAGFYPADRQAFLVILTLGWSIGCFIWGKSYLRKLLKTNADFDF